MAFQFKKQKSNPFVYILFLCAIVLTSCKKQDNETVEIESTVVESYDIERVEPLNWWVDFNNPELQLLVRHPNISETNPSISHKGVTIEKVHKADSPNYLFIDLKISETAKAGKFNIIFKQENKDDLVHTYELKSRKKPAEEYVGFDSSDVMYLITPDRFANANPDNDVNTNLLEKTVDRTQDYGRHGGDIKGITNHLDYISDMGFTAIWPCPLLTNDMPKSSYHGYAMTDFYQIDARFGTLEEYVELADKAREKGIKLVMDQVANHCGSEHWWMKDLPFKDWVNQQKAFETNTPLNNSNHRRTTNQDMYASQRDKDEMNQGWFVRSMPDLNQRNPFMAKYIIQNSIWWVEIAGLGGIRQDTYPYPDKDFMSDWAGAIMTEYPNFNIVGEEWSTNPLLIAYWQEGHQNKDGYDSNLRSTMDFAMQTNIVQALNEEESWNNGFVKIYEGLAVDFAYTKPEDILVFPDNHDMSRIFTQLNGDIPNTKMALATVLTMPRTAQIYYGTEILMNDFEKPGDHGLLRGDFPGGWQGDTVNAFTGEGLTDAQKDMQSFLKKVLNYRKSSKAIHKGKTVHFAPFMGTYFLFRMIEDEVVLLILNKNENPITLDLKRYEEIGLKGKTLKNIVTDEDFIWNDTIELKEKGVLLLSTKK
ncbi:glycoside hydrolase family 13 protein [Flaviramulus sp. BrNp1-15]|uniref:glycoside hydrolase family 13 protein n=1 Tax=Flaviramulus sp. BrNp1-15 TaxID=2916754 RepID=UPI001EE97D69|nr:glycoside hydrolase family 13 protein [Flaviramulus sp. BrNp1-15]ULC59184.1 glycoside hydrolase family 13 protein [Flaviramulus sp. BrNp1-15]